MIFQCWNLLHLLFNENLYISIKNIFASMLKQTWNKTNQPTKQKIQAKYFQVTEAEYWSKLKPCSAQLLSPKCLELSSSNNS